MPAALLYIAPFEYRTTFMCEVHRGLRHYIAATGKVPVWRTCRQSVVLVFIISIFLQFLFSMSNYASNNNLPSFKCLKTV